jgi:UDP-glucose 4-epimerase
MFKLKKAFVTGCAGFVGSNLCKSLLDKGYAVTGIDNLSTGKSKYLDQLISNKNFRFYKIDIYKSKKINDVIKNHSIVFHLAANADVKDGLKHPYKDLQQNTIATFNILESMRKNKIKKIVFSSTGSIYGEPINFPTPENDNFPVQTSLYGASKLASEGLIQAYSIGYGIQSYIFRFVSLFGKNYSHGHLFDFYKQLLVNPKKLFVLGDGNQKKSYLNVSDCIEAIFIALKKSKEKVNVYNLGIEDYITVNQSIKFILSYLKLNPEIRYKGGRRGWVGDSPKILLDTKKIRKLGWKPKKTIKESIFETLYFFEKNKWLFKK